MKKKLLYIVEAMGGGVYTYIVSLTAKLADDFDVYVAYSTRPQTPRNYRMAFDKRVNLIEVSNFTRKINLKKDFLAYLELKKIEKRVNPDIIHLHSSKAGALGRIAFRNKKISMFYTPHGYSFLMDSENLLKKSLYKLVEQKLASNKFVTICCSEGEYLEALKLNKNAFLISNGINVKELNDEVFKICRNTQENNFTVYTLGRICSQKNPKLFNKIALNMPDVNFVWIGDGELKTELTSKNIRVTGWKERAEALKVAVNSDAFLLTSSWEGLPMSLLESMYLRKPCVVSNVIGNRDVIKNEINGYVCGKTNEFVRALRKIEVGDNNVIKGNAYKDILENFNTDVMSKKYKKLYAYFLEKRENR